MENFIFCAKSDSFYFEIVVNSKILLIIDNGGLAYFARIIGLFCQICFCYVPLDAKFNAHLFLRKKYDSKINI